MAALPFALISNTAYASENPETNEISIRDQCKIKSEIIFSNMRDGVVGGSVIGGMTGAIPGAVSGALSGLVAGTMVGAFNAKKELENCTLTANKTQIDSNTTKSLYLPICELDSSHITSNLRDFAIVETIANGMSGGNPMSGIIPSIAAGTLVGLVNASIEQNVCKKNNATTALMSSESKEMSENSNCKLNSSLIFSNMRDFTIGGAVIGGMTGTLPGAVTGALSGTIGGALVGAFQASNEQKQCKKLISE